MEMSVMPTVSAAIACGLACGTRMCGCASASGAIATMNSATVNRAMLIRIFRRSMVPPFVEIVRPESSGDVAQRSIFLFVTITSGSLDIISPGRKETLDAQTRTRIRERVSLHCIARRPNCRRDRFEIHQDHRRDGQDQRH